MNFIYPFIISFMLVFFSELGDKTQLLVLSFSTKDKAKNTNLATAKMKTSVMNKLWYRWKYNKKAGIYYRLFLFKAALVD